MPVLDTQVAWLRAWLVGDEIPDLTEADKDHWNELSTLVIALFLEVVDQWWEKFGREPANIVFLVEACRTQSEWHADKVDPATAERLMLEAISDDEDDEVDDVDPPTRMINYVLLSVAMLKRFKNMSEPGVLDRTLASVRAKADRDLARRAARKAEEAKTR